MFLKYIPLLTFYLLSVFVVTNSSSEEINTGAKLLIEKQVLNKFLVEAKDIIVHYNIYNIGSSSAINVYISDATFSLAHFDIVNGALKFNIPRIAPLSNVTHTIVVRPKEGIWGRFNFTAGEISYLSEGSSEPQLGFTSEPGEGYIVSLKEFEKRFSPHYYDWAIFLIICLATVLFPYKLWVRSKNKYEALVSKKSK